MPTLLQTVLDSTDLIDLAQVEARFPWIYQRDLDCILSPDSDGLLCGLMMSKYLGWRIRGFYDGKVLVCDNRVQPRDCVFLDMEILRQNVRSVGQHILLFNGNRTPRMWAQFSDCFAINEVRGFDGSHDFRRKYPFGTIHFLIVALCRRVQIDVSERGIVPLLFADGTYPTLFDYTENSYDWLRYLQCDESWNPLKIIGNQPRTILSLMRQMMNFWGERDRISIRGERGDRLAITRRGGDGVGFNVVGDQAGLRFSDEARQRGERFIHLLAQLTGWTYDHNRWSWERWRLFRFTKEVLEDMTVDGFEMLMARRPLSLAMTATRRYELTIEAPDRAFDA